MKKIYSTAIAAAFSMSAYAQLNMGVATGNWSGTNSLYLNPANIAGSHHKLVVDVITPIGGVDNSLGTININRGLIGAIRDGEARDIFRYPDGGGAFSMLAPYAEVRGPGLLYNFHQKHSIALTSRIRAMNQFHNFDHSLYQAITDPSFDLGRNVDLTSQNFNYTAHLWTEIGLSYGGVIYDHGFGRLKGGVTLRYLGGVDYIALKGKNLDAHFVAGRDSFYAANSDLEYSSNMADAVTEAQNGFTQKSLFSQFFGPKAGIGMGADLGLVYEFTPYDEVLGTRGDYKFRLSASVIDIGSIKYKAEDNFNLAVTGNGYITANGIMDNVKNFDDFRNYAIKQGFTADATPKDVRLRMPTRLIAGMDYRITGHYYVNATFVGSLADRGRFGNSFYDQFVVTPRYDSRVFSFGVPITFSSLSHTFKAGFGARFSGFFIGSDDLLAVFATGQHGFNFYTGGFVPIAAHKMKDSDNDGVPDKRDNCPDVPGALENDGCPIDLDARDRTERGRETDTTDNCPDLVFDYMVPGAQGTADTDGDGIADNEDACPNVAGPADNHGCPAAAVTKKTANFSVTTIRMVGTSIPDSELNTLDQLAKVLKEYPAATITIEGYGDKKGYASSNRSIGANRAASVKYYLASKGIAKSRMATKGLSSVKNSVVIRINK